MKELPEKEDAIRRPFRQRKPSNGDRGHIAANDLADDWQIAARGNAYIESDYEFDHNGGTWHEEQYFAVWVKDPNATCAAHHYGYATDDPAVDDLTDRYFYAPGAAVTLCYAYTYFPADPSGSDAPSRPGTR